MSTRVCAIKLRELGLVRCLIINLAEKKLHKKLQKVSYFISQSVAEDAPSQRIGHLTFPDLSPPTQRLPDGDGGSATATDDTDDDDGC